MNDVPTPIIHASSLPDYPDCHRRWAARNLSLMVKAAGYSLHERPKHVGAVMGSALDSAATHVMLIKMSEKRVPERTIGDAHEVGQATLKMETRDSVLWDEVTESAREASEEIRKMIFSWYNGVAPMIEPIAVQETIEVYHEPTGLMVTGKTDIITAESLIDNKSGRMARDNAAQYGIYSRQQRVKGRKIDRIYEPYTPRVRAKAVQPEPRFYTYDPVVAENASENILRRIHRDIEDFKERQEPDAFLANPRSMLCSAKFCPAHGTNFCPESKGRT